MKNKKALFIGLLFLGLLFGPVLVWAADTAEIDAINQQITARKEKIKQLEETMGKYQKNIDQKRLEAVSLKNQLSILDNHLAQIETDVKMTEEKIGETNLEIDALKLSIGDKEAVIARQKKIIAKIIQKINADDQKNFIEIMLTNDNFSEFYNQLQYLNNIYGDLGRSIKTLRTAKEDLADKKSQVEAKKKLYEDLKQQLENKKKDLGDQTNVKQNLLVQTQSSELRYRTLLSSLKQQYQQTENEVKAYEEEVRKKLAAQDKISNTAGSGGFDWPLSNRYITAAFHDSDYPYRKVFEHSGVDIRASQGTSVRAAKAGYVARAKRCTTASCYCIK